MGTSDSLRPPKAVLLDLDGTVLDNGGLPGVATQTCAAVCGMVEGLDADQLLAANTEAWTKLWRAVEHACWVGEMDGHAVSREAWRRALEICGCGDETAVEYAFDVYRRLARDTFRPYPDVQDLFDYATEHDLALGLVTNGPSDLQRDKIQALQIEDRLKTIAISGEWRVAKPDPALFRVALDELGVHPEHTWFIGDSLVTDVAGAHASGLTAIWLNRLPQSLPVNGSAPHVEAWSLSEVLGWLAEPS